MAGVVKNTLGQLLEKARTDKRKIIYESLSLDEPLNDDEDSLTLKDKIPEGDTPPQIKSELKIELSKAYQKLTPQQQKLCRLLVEENISINEACRRLDKHRMVVYREIARIRELFEKEGLKDYLNNF
jgi:DNA-directed RNA polymerase specialized sigma24 family protein